MAQYKNPIIPGFYPDPSICLVGDDYYLVNSSFEFFPGVPLWHSKDLVNWEQKSYVLDRQSQLNLDKARTSGGIFAPTIREHNGRFYMIVTNVSNGGNFYVWTDDINGTWSEPIYVAQGGIDPSIFFDDDGTVYFHSTYSDAEGKNCIGQCTIDIETGEILEKTRILSYGSGGKAPEGPHMYKINGYYYLMLAEGGTEYGHMETISRSLSPWGPWELCPHNPFLTHRNSNNVPGFFQGLGHADLFEGKDGKWWIVFHGIRPTQFMFHHVGRETMIAPVEWDEKGWPVVYSGNYITTVMDTNRDVPVQDPHRFDTADKFDSPAPRLEWSYLRNPDMSRYEFGNGLKLIGGEDTLDGMGSPTWLGRRQQHIDMSAEAIMSFNPESEAFETGLGVFHTNEHHYDLIITKRSGKTVCLLRRRVVDMLIESEPVILEDSGQFKLKIESNRLEYRFYVEINGENVLVGTGSTQLLSTECMNCTFTGCFIGMFAVGSGKADVSEFNYTSKE